MGPRAVMRARGNRVVDPDTFQFRVGEFAYSGTSTCSLKTSTQSTRQSLKVCAEHESVSHPMHRTPAGVAPGAAPPPAETPGLGPVSRNGRCPALASSSAMC